MTVNTGHQSVFIRTKNACMLQALFDLEATNQDFKTDLRDLYITSAQLIDVTPSKNAIIIHVPYRLLKGFQKIQQRLVRELEKKFSGKDVVLVANRRIMPRTKNGSSKARPRSRTLTHVSTKSAQAAHVFVHNVMQVNTLPMSS